MPYSKKDLKQLALDYIARLDDNEGLHNEMWGTPGELAEQILKPFFDQVFGFDLNSEQDPDVIVAKQGAEFTASIRGVPQRFKFVGSTGRGDLHVLNLNKNQLDLYSYYAPEHSYTIEEIIADWQ